MTLESKLLQEEERSAPRVYKTEVLAGYVTASIMTAAIATGEKEEEATMALQSLLPSSGEWFVCDEPSTYTRCFVIQVTTTNSVVPSLPLPRKKTDQLHFL